MSIAEEADVETLSFGPLENSVGFLLRIAQLTVYERTFAELDRRDVPIGEYTILLAIGLNPGVRQGVLADRLRIKWSNMTKLIRSLEGRGLIERLVSPRDRRAISLRLTAAGEKWVEEHKALVLRAVERSVASLDEDEQKTLQSLLRKVAGWPQL